MKNVKPKNNKKQAHGYWIMYWSNGNLMYKGNYVNDKPVGYWEWYMVNCGLHSKQYYI